MTNFLDFNLIGVSEFWMTRWLTGIWLLGVGLTLGLVALGILVGIFSLLSKVPVLEKLRRSGQAHFFALGGTILLGAGLSIWSRSFFMSEIDASNRGDEWLLVSISLFLFAALASWSFFYCSSPQLIGELRSILFDGVGGNILAVLIGTSVIGLLCSFVAESPMAILKSTPQMFSTGEKSHTIIVKGTANPDEDPPFQPIDISYDGTLLTRVQVKTNRNIVLADAPAISQFMMKPVSIDRDGEVVWIRKGTEAPPVPLSPGSQIHIQNKEIQDAEVQFLFETRPATPEVTTIFLTALCVVGFGLIFMLQQGVAPKASAIALATAKSEVAQPLFTILVTLSLLLILLWVFTPFFTFGEDIKLLKDCGLTLVLLAALFQGVWSASSSVSDEIEGRTALTVLSKPIGRRSFLIGKMLGIFWIVFLLFFIVGWWELLWVAYKPIYDSKESSQELPLWQICHMEMVRTIPGLAMNLFQAITLSFFSVAISTRVPQLANFTICFVIYLLGHLTESLVSVSEERFAPIQFFGQLIAVIVPNLEHFSMQSAIDSGNPIPAAFLAGTMIYALLYASLAVLLGLLLFEDRDLA